MRRTMLFLPSNNPNLMMNGSALEADTLIFDLEDAVAPDQKDAARDLLKSALKYLDFGRHEILVRINSLDTPYWKADLRAIMNEKIDAIMPPKVSDAAYIQELDAEMTALEEEFGIAPGKVKILALLETAMGIENAYPIACASKRMLGLFLGAEDLSADLRCPRTKGGEEIRYARGKIVSSARAAGIEVYDTPFTDVRDLEGLEEDARYAKGLGFSGKACISPAHLSIVNRVFSPTEKEIQYALEVFSAIEEAKRQGKGAISLRGKMIDAPIVTRARLVLEAASEIEGEDYFA